MPAIRFPASAVPLLPLCKGHGENPVFRTYADLLSFLAALGLHAVEEHSEPLDPRPKYVDTPNAIGVEVFENRGLLQNLVMIALAHDRSPDAAQDEDLLCKIAELYAARGGSSLAALLMKQDPAEWPTVIARIICKPEEHDTQI
jgi:hypothetical protein